MANPFRILLISGSTRAASTNTALLRTAQVVAPMLATVLGYLNVDVVEAACVRIPVSRAQVGEDGLIVDAAIREQIAGVLSTLARHVSEGHP